MNIYRKRRVLVPIVLLIGFFNIIIIFYPRKIQDEYSDEFLSNEVFGESDVNELSNIVNRFYDNRKSWKTSNLGSILFKNATYGNIHSNQLQNKTYTVYVWKYWDWLKKRHVYNYNSKDKNKPDEILKDCHVRNCKFYGEEKYMESADAVLVHMQRKVFPKVPKRNPKQIWIFLSDESPINTFSLSDRNNKITLSDMSGVFNWTMTYRTESDIPVPYGRTVARQYPILIETTDPSEALHKLVPYWKEKRRDPLAMILVSNCITSRMQILHGLQNFLGVDIFGGCSDVEENKKMCPGHFTADCMLPSEYLFYLVFENSQCREYITEKVFQHAYSKGAIPVIIGPFLKDCKNLLPPHSFLHIQNYKNIQDLSEHMLEISQDDEKILQYHQWRKHFLVLNEHGYFKTKSYHFCRICEAINYNDKAAKSYNTDDLSLFFDKNKLCDLEYGSKIIY